MKRRRLSIELDERQQLILALLVVIMVAFSMLYCLGLASVLLRENLDKAPLPLNENGLEIEEGTALFDPAVDPMLQTPEVP